MSMPLDGIRVVALEQAVAAPFCSRQLAEMGADVIKIERPPDGDFARHYDHALQGQSTHFVWLNRGKRSVALDLKTERGSQLLRKLVERADVFVHNLAPGAVERLGFGYEELRGACTRLIWCAISGYGPDGPYRDKKAYDLLIQAEAGVVGLTGTPDAPAKAGVSVADLAAGHYAYSSILAALLHRAKTGCGDRIDISMLECLVEWATPQIYHWQGSCNIPQRQGLRHSTIVPYGAYRCADGSVIFAIQNQREWRDFCSIVVQQPPLADDARFASNEARLEHREALETLIEEHFEALPAAAVLHRLDEAGIASANLNEIPAVAAHPQLTARGRWSTVSTADGVMPALLPPHNLASVMPSLGAVPEMGQHTAEVIAELEMCDALL